MCEILVSISELVIGILILKNFCLPINTGLSASAIVKCLKCLTCLSFENESDLEEYRLFTVKWIFLPFSKVIFVLNLAEFEYLLIRYENILSFGNQTMFYVYGILCVIGLISMFAYLITLEVLAGFTDFLKSITNLKLMLMIYHYINTIINLSMLIAIQGGFTLDVPRHCLEFTIFMFSIFDIIQSIIHFFISLASWCISRKSNSINPEF